MACAASDDLGGLIARIVARDDAALGALYERTVARVFALARTILRNDADAEEVTCDVFAQAWSRACLYRTERGTVLTWLLTMCRSRALDVLRRQRARLASLDAPVEEASIEWPDPVHLLQEGSRVHAALAELQVSQRQVIGLAYFRGFTHAEIAQSLGLSLGTVKAHLHRGLLVLRQALTDQRTR